ARERWLTRAEAAQLLRAAWRAKDRLTGRPMGRHVARFILVALYTGTRASAVCQAALRPIEGQAFVDVERGVFYRRPSGEIETKKRRPPVVLPERLRAHIWRWVDKGIARDFVVEWNGKPVGSVRKGFESAAKTAGLGKDVTPHVLRHTAATWLMQNGVDPFEAAGFLGMSTQMLLERYGHHHPDHQREAAKAITRPPPFRHRLGRMEPEQTVANLRIDSK
ncbi:MAG: site-specific integrase, partial [Hyphomicrobiales bacterium]